MRFTSIILLILVATMATLAAPAKENKLVRIPFTKAVRKRSNFRHSMENSSNANATSVLSRRATSSILLTSFREIVWRGTIAIGTPQQNFRFIMDTGGGSTWVVDDTCQGNCGNVDKYNGRVSSTFNDLAKPFTAKYDNGESVAGTWTADNLGLGYNSDVIVTQQIFGRANQVPTDLVTDYDSSGILGLGFRTRVSEEPDIPVVIENLRSQNVIDKNVISCHFIKNDDIDAGEILFGGVDNEFISGDILYTPIVLNQGLPDWIIPIADIQVAGSSLGQSNVAYFDTGMGDIFLSDAAAQAVYAGITGAEKTDDNGWLVPAPFPSDVSLVIGPRVFTIPAADLLTDIQVGDKFVGTIQGGANNLWVIGDAFIKNHYVVFDFEGNTIGIANRNDL